MFYNRSLPYLFILLALPLSSQAMDTSRVNHKSNATSTNNVFDYCRRFQEVFEHLMPQFTKDNGLLDIEMDCYGINKIEDNMSPNKADWQRKIPIMVDPNQYNEKIIDSIVDRNTSVDRNTRNLTKEEYEIVQQMKEDFSSDFSLIKMVAFLMIDRKVASVSPDLAIKYTGSEDPHQASKDAYKYLQNKYWNNTTQRFLERKRDANQGLSGITPPQRIFEAKNVEDKKNPQDDLLQELRRARSFKK